MTLIGFGIILHRMCIGKRETTKVFIDATLLPRYEIVAADSATVPQYEMIATNKVAIVEEVTHGEIIAGST